ncbi:hypothetical protein Q1695_000562 [Nippostrongylus brasiliensis]|nr:hypothetical protein Q1695_000562 [Nippostrongylus brasiliensis]
MTMLHQGRQTSVGDSSRSKSTVRRSIDLWRRRVSSLHINVPAHAIVFYQVIMMNNDMPTSVPDSTAKQIMRKCQVVMMNNDTPTSVTGVHSRLCPVVQHLTMMETTLLSKLLGDVKCQRLYMTLSSWYVESLEDYSHSMMAWDQQPATIVVTRSLVYLMRDMPVVFPILLWFLHCLSRSFHRVVLVEDRQQTKDSSMTAIYQRYETSPLYSDTSVVSFL